jgi:magnesium-transporting ATPase (P-type)
MSTTATRGNEMRTGGGQPSDKPGAGVQISGTAWHSMDAERVLAEIRSAPEGLSAGEASKRLAEVGPNTLPRGKKETPLDLLWRQINNPLIWVLIASGVIAMLVDPGDGIKNGLVILAVVALNTIIGFVQEFKAGKAIEALSKMVPENVTVLRDGAKASLPAAELVPGDIVMLASGDRVPADMRLIAVRSLQVEEAALTGESVPTEKQLASVAPAAGVGDRLCMVFGGTLCTYGTGTAVVVETAGRTELGKISQMLKETTDLETPLTKALAKIGKIITIAIIIIAVVMLIIGTVRTYGAMEALAATAAASGAVVPDPSWITALRETVIFAIALAVGAIPEGLPAIVTIALAIGVQRMAARRAVIRKLPAVETLGSTTVICSDKTGTLTRNEMTVQSIWTPQDGAAEVSGVGYEPVGEMRRAGSAAPVSGSARELFRVGLLCNDATLVKGENGLWKITGDPTEGALVTAAEKFGLKTDATRNAAARLDAIPFESENQFMATLHKHDGGGDAGAGNLIIVKGAPEVVIKRSEGIDAKMVLGEVERLASQGMRVLAFAVKRVGSKADVQMADVAGGLTLVGLQGMIDPPRTEAIEAIKRCHGAGITVKMITGDHKLTAAAIGQQLNITKPGDKAVTGAQLAEMNDEQLRAAASSNNVFARVAPEHKLKLVKALQAQSHVVAMTGDGVNDAPALKQANIGVAMGITGTSVSKEASSIVLTDDNFASIAAAVEEGRRVYDNLIKSLAFVLPTNLGLAMILMAAVAFFPFQQVVETIDGVAKATKELLLPMLPTQLLWINLVATVALALPLAFEAKEPNVMRRPPRKSDEPVLSSFVVIRTFVAAILMTAACIGLFLWEYNVALKAGVDGVAALAKAQTMAVTTVIMFQIFYMLNCRSLRDSIFKIGLFSNKSVFIGIGSLLVLQAMFIYLPIMHTVFGSAPLGVRDIVLAVLAGMIILPVISIEKWNRNRNSGSAIAESGVARSAT